MNVSLIISTYNWPGALQLCLEGVMRQTVMPTQILLADDGSGDSTRAVVERFAALSPVPVRHIWHEDAGFRLAAIRNKAIAASPGDYIVQIDGDVIPERHFIEDHIAFARRGYFTAGSRGLITEPLTIALLAGQASSESLSPRREGVSNRNNAFRSPILASLYRTLGPNRYVKGCNMAFWRDDLIRVNGYDEGFVGWGGEDTELVTRLHNIGIRQQAMKFRGVIYHLHHGEAEKSNLKANHQLYLDSLSRRATYCDRGINQYFSTPTSDNAAGEEISSK